MTSTAAEGPVAQAGPEPRIIVMIGAPGAGKGTQAERLAELLGLPHVSTGKLFRDAVHSGQPLGSLVRSYVEVGSLVPDDVTIDVVDQRLREGDARRGAILDGFPRTRDQAVALEDLMASAGSRVSAALYVEVPTSELMARLTGRRICALDDQHVYHIVARPPKVAGKCDLDGARLEQRNDDKPATVQRRLDQQLPPMYDVIDHYADRGTLFSVQGDQPADDVTDELMQALSAAARSNRT